MKFTIMETPHVTHRIECNKKEFESKFSYNPNLKNFLDIVSCWGGSDVGSDIYLSWEINNKIIDSVQNILEERFYIYLRKEE